MTRKKRNLTLKGKEVSIEADGRFLFSFLVEGEGEDAVYEDFLLRESITLAEGEVYVEEALFSPEGFLDRSWGTVLGQNLDLDLIEEIRQAGTHSVPEEYIIPLRIYSASLTKDSKRLSDWLDGKAERTSTLEDLFWGPDMPLRSKADRAAYFVYLDELRREARGGGITTPKKIGEDRPQLHGGLDAMLVRQGGEIISGKMYIQGDITLIESAAYGVAARVINTKDIPSDGVVDLEKVDSLRVVHAGKNLDYIASFKGR